MSDTVTAVARHRFAALTAEQVFDAWIDQDLVRLWMERHLKERDAAAALSRIEIDPVVGGQFLFADTRPESEAWGTYRALDRPGRVVFSWFVSAEEEAEDNSLVIIDIVPRDTGCDVTISHEMSAEWADYLDQTANAWQSMLEAIDKTFSRAPHTAD